MTFTRILLTLGLAVLLSAGGFSSAASAQSDCLTGPARGHWNLPSRIERGIVRGILVQGTRDGRKATFALDARLAPVPGVPGGKLEGTLYIIVPGPALRPFAQVQGRYERDRNGQGTFEAAILQESLKLIPVEIGKIVGTFSDRPEAGTNVPGRFLGRWSLCR